MTKPKKTKKVGVKRRENKDIVKKKKTSAKQKEFQTFMLWLALPKVFLGKPDNYLESIGIVEEEAKELMKIKNMSQFAKKYKVRNTTLTDWRKKIKTENLMDNTKDYFRKLSKNVYGSFYHATLKHGDAPRVRLWEEVFNEKESEGNLKLLNINLINYGDKKNDLYNNREKGKGM